MRPRIALLNASYEPEHTRRNFRRELDAELVEFHTPAGELPETVGFDAAVVTGSRASVYWDEPWIGEVKRWVGAAIEHGLPTLGVCFGHQLVADVLGGAVTGMGEYELGYRRIPRREGSTLLAGTGRQLTAFQTHSDHVSQLPPGATLLAANEYGIQGFRKGHAWGVQFHPEYDTETARQVTRKYLGERRAVDEDEVKRVLDGIDAETYSAACETKILFENFTTYVRRTHEPTPTGGVD